MNKIEWCNWSFNECLKPSNKWLVKRDCSDTMTLTRGDSKNWLAHKASLKSVYVGNPPPPDSKCPKCYKYVNGVNPYDDGETWRK